MTRRRRPRLLALAVLAAILLPACGGRFRPPAAEVDGVPIAESTLEERLDALLADPGFAQQVQGPGGSERRRDLTRAFLGFLIRQEIIEAYARAHRISVEDAEVDAAVDQTVQQLGGRERFDEELRRRGLTLADVRENIRGSILAEKVRRAVVVERVGATADPAQAEEAFSAWLEERLQGAEIRVNPRFGVFDPRRGTVCRPTSTAGTLACPQV